MKKFNVAIVGATGAVGNEIIRLLAKREFPVNQLKLLASERSAGKRVATPFGEIIIEACDKASFVNQDFVFFASGGEHSKQFAPIAAEAGAIVIDNSSAFRLEDDVPLVVPEVNPEAAFQHKGIIANPNCSTIQMVAALWPLYRQSRIKRIQVATYQAVSGAGQPGLEELENQTRAWSSGEDLQVSAFTKQIAFNVIPHIDVFQDNGYTKEEMKMVYETWKIMGDDQIKISPTCVRVPVLRAHSEAITIETEDYIGEEAAREILANAKGIQVIDKRENGGYPTPLEVSEQMDTYVGRIRDDLACENGLSMWVVADQLWKGAALNAIQIAELFTEGSRA